MSDLISRQDAIDAIADTIVRGENLGYGIAEDILYSVPSAEPERKKGQWIDTGSGQECSECHEIQYGYDNFRYFCAFCGADMRGEEE